MFFLVLYSIKEDASAQYQKKFDGLNVYSMPYYNECSIKIDASLLIVEGNKTFIADTSIINKIHRGLLNMKMLTSNESLRILRESFSKYSIDVRAVFVFYSKLTEETIGISRQYLMFVDNAVFERNYIALEDVVKPSAELYRSLFPTREEIIYQK